MSHADHSWILDSGGAGRGAWQGGVIHRFMAWGREHGALPAVTMGASAGGYAAADVATGTEDTVTKGWTWWGRGETFGFGEPLPPGWRFRGIGRFRATLHASVHYVMADRELAALFDLPLGGPEGPPCEPPKKILIFTTRVRRKDGRAFGTADMARYFLRSATRKLPPALKYLPRLYDEDLIVFAAPLPRELESELVRPLTPANFHAVLEASCLVPLAMGAPIAPEALNRAGDVAGDRGAVFMDGGFAVKMPMAIFEEDGRYRQVGEWARTRKSIVFCCDPAGNLWETSSRLRRLNDNPAVRESIEAGRLLVVHPDHPVEAGFLCTDNERIMRTFRRGQEQGDRLLASDAVRRFLEF